MLEKFSSSEHFSQADKLTKNDSLEILKKDFPLESNSDWEVKPLPKVQELPPLYAVENRQNLALVEKGNSEIESTSFDLDLDESVELNDENLENEIKKTIIDVKTLPIEQAKDVINGELAPNTIYSMGNGNLYESDDKGRVVKKKFIPFIVEDKRSFKDSKNTSEVGKLGKEGDHGGHIQAHSLGEPLIKSICSLKMVTLIWRNIKP